MRLQLKTSTLLPAFLLALAPGIAEAQIPAAKQSVIVFDIQMGKIRNGSLYKKLNGDQMVTEIQGEGAEVDLTHVDRVIGSVGYPKNVQEIEKASQGGDLPFEFFVRGIFSDPAAAQNLYEEFAENSNVVETDEKKYLRPNQNDAPQNLSICRLDDKTMEIGTDGYVMEKSRNFRTPRLSEAWGKLPAYPIRFAVDAETAEALVDEALQMLGEQVPPQAAIMLASVKEIATISVAIDIDSNPMIAISLTGKSEEATTALAATLNGLLTMAKGMGQQVAGQLPSPQMQNAANEILSALQAHQKGTTIVLNIPRPEGFDEIVVQAAAAAKAAGKAMEKQNNMRQIALAMHNYHDTYNKLPWLTFHESQSKDLSWRVRVLPFVEQMELFESMDVHKAHNEAPNSQFAKQMPAIFGDKDKGTMVYTIDHQNMPTSFRDISDGTSNTIAMIQAPATVGWMQPKNISIDDAIKVIQSTPAGESAIVCMYDGAVLELDPATDADQLRAMMTYNGGEIIER